MSTTCDFYIEKMPNDRIQWSRKKYIFVQVDKQFIPKVYKNTCNELNYGNELFSTNHLIEICVKFVIFFQLFAFKSYDDMLEIPLQPLYDNLDSYTYEVFEKDPIKYVFYQRAIEQALLDKIPIEEVETKTVSSK